MAFGTLRDRRTENEKRAVYDIMERGKFSWATVCITTQTAFGSGSLEKMQTVQPWGTKSQTDTDTVDDGGL